MAMMARKLFFRALHHPDERSFFSLSLNLFLAAMVLLNIGELVWMSVPQHGERYTAFAEVSQRFFVVVFTIEYVLRVWSAAGEAVSPSEIRSRRIAYIRSPMGLVDLLSFLPIFFIWLFPGEALGDWRMLKLIAIVRILKLTRYSDSISMLARLYHDNKSTLLAAAMIMMILCFMAATGIYYFERFAQPEHFGSIPQSMWWSLVTLTTVGYGDVVPITTGGKLFAVLVMISGVGIAAMPAGIFASSFVQLVKEQERQRRSARRRKTRQELSGNEELSPELHEIHVHFSRSEQREVDYLRAEFGLTFEQSVCIVMHFRH